MVLELATAELEEETDTDEERDNSEEDVAPGAETVEIVDYSPVRQVLLLVRVLVSVEILLETSRR